MKNRALPAVLFFGLISTAAFSQTPAGAPSGTTGICKDGTFTSVESKAGACSGHKGVKTWMGKTSGDADKSGTPAAAPAGAAAGASSSAAASPTVKPSSTMPSAGANRPMQQAAGGGAGKVWVNTDSKVYHCPGTKYYGKTKKGSYMTEAEATAAGNHADHKKTCTK